jgi:hypothetical protein
MNLSFQELTLDPAIKPSITIDVLILPDTSMVVNLSRMDLLGGSQGRGVVAR